MPVTGRGRQDPHGIGWWVADTEPNDRFDLYSRGNTGEVFPHVMSALTGTLIAADVDRGQLAFLRETGLLTRKELAPLRGATGVFGGYLYGSASLFRLMGVRAPGMSIADIDAQLVGSAAATELPPYERRPGDRNLVASLRIGRYLAAALRRPTLSALDAAAAEAEQYLDALPAPSAPDGEFLAYLADYPPRLGASMHRLLRYSAIAGGGRAALDRILERRGAPPGFANRLVSGAADVVSAELARGPWHLSRIVADDPALTARFDRGLDSPGDDLLADVAGTALAAPLRDFLALHGHRGNDEYELATPCWAMDPRPVFAAIDRLRFAPPDRDPDLALARLIADRVMAERELDGLLPRPLRRLVRHAARVSRAGSAGRERAKDVLVRENLGARLALAELHRRTAARGGPAEYRDFCCIAADELAAFVADPVPFRDAIEQRQARRDFLDARVPPSWFQGRISDPVTWPLRERAPRRSGRRGDDEVLTGIGASGGLVSGPVRVVTDPADPRGLAPGDVLVCPLTDPSWTPLFLVAAAVVCDQGALQSHAAIVARELGLPAVVSVPGATGLADGTVVTVDGHAGRVTIERAP